MKNFLFVFPRVATAGQYYNFPLGLAYVASYMKEKGFNVFCLNTCLYDDSLEQLLADSIVDKKIDVLCTGSMSYYWNEVNKVLEVAKKVKPEIVTVVGGAIITSEPKLALENMPIDFGVIGEGEETMADLADALCRERDVTSVKGIIFHNKDSNLTTTASRDPIADLDVLPFPDYEGFGYEKWLSLSWITQPSIKGLFFDLFQDKRLGEIIASRSCPYNCTFCYHPLGQKYRQRSLDNVFKEIDYLFGKYRINVLTLLDELFSKDNQRVHEFTDRIKKYNIKWIAQWRVDNVNEEVLKRLKGSGIFMLGLGVESLSDKILKSMKKNTTRAQIERAFKLAHDAGVRASGNIILGDPEETEETIHESLDWYLKHLEYDISIDLIVAVPDAPVYRYAIVHKLIKNRLEHIKKRFPAINLTKISDRKFNKIKKEIIVWSSTFEHLLPGNVVYSKRESEVYNGKSIYTFKVGCPVCRHISEYRYIRYSLRPYAPILCKNCYKTLKIKTNEAFPNDYNVVYAYFLQYCIIFYRRYLAKYSFFRKISQLLKASGIR